MFRVNLKNKKVLSAVGIILGLNFVLASATRVNAQANNNEVNSQDQGEVSQSGTIKNLGLPTNRRDGGSRGVCTSVSSSKFVAFIPEMGVNLTASTTPKLYFHIPEAEGEQTIEFVLRDSADRLVYEEFVSVAGESGIMSIEIPLATAQASVQEDANYRWYLSNICNASNRSQDVVLEGWIRYQALSDASQAKAAALSDREKLSFYQSQNLWHDSLEVASQDDAKWSELLTEIGLEEFSAQPFIQK